MYVLSSNPFINFPGTSQVYPSLPALQEMEPEPTGPLWRPVSLPPSPREAAHWSQNFYPPESMYGTLADSHHILPTGKSHGVNLSQLQKDACRY